MRWLALVVAVAASAAPALAFERGDTCTLKAPLLVVINRPEGKLETTVDVGTDVEVVAIGDEGRARISTGDTKGSVSVRDLEAACQGTLQMCKLNADILLFEQNRSDSKSWKIKKGAPVSVLRQGKVWAHLRVDDLEGFAKTDELKGRCPLVAGGTTKQTEPDTPTEEVERGEGPGVLFVPFLLEGAAPAGNADQLGEVFFDRLAFYRPDAARLPLVGDRSGDKGGWKQHVAASAARAKAAGLAYVVVGKLAVESSPEGKGVLVVSLAMIDSATGNTLKGVRTRPTTKLDDPWASNMLAVLLPLVRAAPGSKIPDPPPPVKPTTTEQQQKEKTPATANATDGPTPWFANPWGYAALGGAVLLGVGSGVAGALASADNTAANEAAPIDDSRSELRASALTKAIAADSLLVGAGVVGVTSLVVFATRAGLSE